MPGSSGTISYSKKSDMPFSCAFVQEVFRYRPIAPIGLPHKLSERTQFGKWIIPKGTQVQHITFKERLFYQTFLT